MELIKQVIGSYEASYGNYHAGTAWFFQKACRRVVEINNDFTDEHGTYFLSIPNLVFKIHFRIEKYGDKNYFKPNGIYVAAVNSRQTLFLPLPNIFGDCSICLGEVRIPNVNSPKELVDFEVTHFWNSIFEISEVWTKESVKEGRCKGFLNWQKNTKENPNWCPDESDLYPLPLYDKNLFWGVRQHLIAQELGPHYDNFKEFFL